jgi:hypothetical protein
MFIWYPMNFKIDVTPKSIDIKLMWCIVRIGTSCITIDSTTLWCILVVFVFHAHHLSIMNQILSFDLDDWMKHRSTMWFHMVEHFKMRKTIFFGSLRKWGHWLLNKTQNIVNNSCWNLIDLCNLEVFTCVNLFTYIEIFITIIYIVYLVLHE